MTMTMKTTLAFLAHLGVFFQSAAAGNALPRGGAGPFVAAPARHLSEMSEDAFLCDDGYAPSGETCEDECGGKCCIGKNACQEGNFYVFPDGSCNGTHACYYAGSSKSPGLISGGSCSGEYACFVAHRGGGDITNGSCVGREACNYLWYGNYDSAPSLESCCKGPKACQFVGCDESVVCPPPTPPLPVDCTKPPVSAPSAPPIDSPSSLPGCVPKARFQFSCVAKNKKRSCAKELLCKWKNKKCVSICETKNKKACRKPLFKKNRVCKIN